MVISQACYKLALQRRINLEHDDNDEDLEGRRHGLI
jgi:hypothetical protein